MILLTCIVIGCSNIKNEKDTYAPDTILQTQNVALALPEEKTEELPPDPTPEETESFSGLTDNFPDFTLYTLSNDSLEAEITNGMAKLLQIYDTMHYAKITSSYGWERPCYVPAQDGEGYMSVETEEETKKWFFDRDNKLRAFSIISDGP